MAFVNIQCPKCLHYLREEPAAYTCMYCGYYREREVSPKMQRLQAAIDRQYQPRSYECLTNWVI